MIVSRHNMYYATCEHATQAGAQAGRLMVGGAGAPVCPPGPLVYVYTSPPVCVERKNENN